MEDKIIVNSSELEDVFELAKHLRRDDINELRALNTTPRRSLLRGFIYSDECFTAKFKGKIIGMFGYSGFLMPSDTATIWFLGSDEMTRHPVAFLRDGRKYIEKFSKKYSVLFNVVDKRNKTHIKWLKHVGMTFTNSVIVNGYEFLRFYKNRKEGNNV